MGIYDNISDWIKEQTGIGGGQTVTQIATQTQDIAFTPDILVDVRVDMEPLAKLSETLDRQLTAIKLSTVASSAVKSGPTPLKPEALILPVGLVFISWFFLKRFKTV